jgi:hypothetical protein
MTVLEHVHQVTNSKCDISNALLTVAIFKWFVSAVIKQCAAPDLGFVAVV